MITTFPPLFAEDYTCDECRYDYPATSMADATDRIAGVPETLHTTLNGLPEQVMRLHPVPGAWSVVEYLAHMRDVLTIYTLRLHRALHEETPVMEPVLQDVRVTRFRYNNRSPEALIAEIDDQTSGLLDEIAEIKDDQWGRTIKRETGETRTVRWLVHQAAHEVTHHTTDVAHIAVKAKASQSHVPEGSCDHC